MKGLSKHLNNRFDYEYIRNHLPEEQWQAEWRSLLDGRYIWRTVGEVDSVVAAGKVDSTHRVMTEAMPSINSGAPQTRFVQQELVENPGAKIFRIGFTVAEVEAALSGQMKDGSKYRLNSSGTLYHILECSYSNDTAEQVTLADIAAQHPNAKPCGRCNPPSIT